MPGLFDGTPLQRPVTCARCEKPLPECRCPRAKNAAGQPGEILLPKDQPARVRREKRRGKIVTVIAGLDPHATDLASMLKGFKSTLGTGGTIAGEPDRPELELQGDHRDAVLKHLLAQGYPAKPAGG